MTTPQRLEPPPRSTDALWRWLFEIYRRLVTTGLLDIDWSTVNKTVSDIADITDKSHTNLTDIGTNTHPQVDDHIAASTNVHGIGSASAVVGTNTVQQIENKTVSDLQMDLDGPARTPAEGLMFWDTDAKTLAVKLDGPETTLQIGQELHVRVLNKTGSDILNGQVVYVNGQHGGRPTVALAKADDATTSKITGVATEKIEDNTNGYITVFGLVRDLDTSAYSAGDKIYLSAATAGAFTKTAPSFPNYVSFIGRVIVVHATDGIIGVNPGIDHTNGVMVTGLGAKTAKIGTIGTNYSEFESDGTLVFQGNARTWNDSQAAVYYMRPGGTALTLDVLLGGIYQYRLDATDEVHSQIQLSHAYKVNSTVEFHVHLINKNAIGATNYNVGIELEWAWGSIDSVIPAAATESTVNCSFQNASALTHKVFEIKTMTPTTGQGSISSIIMFRLKRVTATTQNYATNDIFIAGIDVHIEQDTTGSRQEYIK